MKSFKKLIAVSLLASSFTFMPQVYFLPKMSVAHAEVRTYEGFGEYVISGDQTPEFAIRRAEDYAKRDAAEQAGVYIRSQSKVENSKLTKDEIYTLTAGILSVNKSDYKLELIDNGKYAKVIVTITVNIDIEKFYAEIKEWKARDEKERAKIVSQDNALQKIIDEQKKQIEDLKNQIANAKTAQDETKIKNKLKEIDIESLYAQKLEEGNKLRKNKKYNEAIKLYTEAINLMPNKAEAYTRRGVTYDYIENHEAELNDYTKAIEVEPNNAELYFYRGTIYDVIFEQYDKALADYTKALELDPNIGIDGLIDVLTPYDCIEMITWVEQNIAIDKGVESFTKIINMYPNIATSYKYRARCYEYMKQYDKAATDYTKMIEVEPTNSSNYIERANFYKGLKQYDKVIDNYTEMIKNNPKSVEAYEQRGNAYRDLLKDYNHAIADYTKMIELDPKNNDGYFYRAYSYAELKHYTAAIEDYTRCIKLNPKGNSAYNNRGNIYKKLYRYDKALADYNEAIKIYPYDAMYYNNRSNLYKELKQYDKVVDNYTEMIKNNPKSADAYNGRGVAYWDLQDYKKALADFDKAIECDPKEGMYYNNRGLAYQKLGDKAKAQADFDKAKELGYKN